jgi:hypothetical protein
MEGTGIGFPNDGIKLGVVFGAGAGAVAGGCCPHASVAPSRKKENLIFIE